MTGVVVGATVDSAAAGAGVGVGVVTVSGADPAALGAWYGVDRVPVPDRGTDGGGGTHKRRSWPPAMYTTLSGVSPVTSKYTFPVVSCPGPRVAGLTPCAVAAPNRARYV